MYTIIEYIGYKSDEVAPSAAAPATARYRIVATRQLRRRVAVASRARGGRWTVSLYGMACSKMRDLFQSSGSVCVSVSLGEGARKMAKR